MSLNATPRSERVHIALFGKRNAGKSSVINAITNQQLSIVSDIEGTTTDPVYKSIEILPIGPCVIIDTAGLDDVGELGDLRRNKTLEVLNKTDIALIVADSTKGITGYDKEIIAEVKKKKIPLMILMNKIDERNFEVNEIENLKKEFDCEVLKVSAVTKVGINEVKEKISFLIPQDKENFRLLEGLVEPKDVVVLVTPIDTGAPKGRMILPQQQVIRELLDSDAIAMVTKENTLKETLESLKESPKLVITDSQAFSKVSKVVPKDIKLTGFSIVFARYKGELTELIKGVKVLEKLKDGDKILISEACTHHRQEDDIGAVKIPKWIKEKTGKNLEFHHSSGGTFTEDVKKYSLIVHCGACMINRKAMLKRIDDAKVYQVPIVNYGILIAYLNGMLDRALEPFPDAKNIYENKE
ncbi:[FeFe] hydrogenase H-cluster maturation GTPase HydF [Clostridium cellulovorans]|uniref:Small GTP-binding protein n=1 Tax=Clostridium cellulovorans (strain ATCC 35296 / DSM 3052 / OCM 3 / 743B) TaxID=573061 RepID=D9SRK5_CLOC7|nr:[FeFe] hydrogenase H-cluster maturation GTPase HydF [Clostridium cellulovorans]ADL52434.1 small GTP-binding protein [Clostridium cellulovorans 743B]